MGKGGWSAEDLNLATFESASNINPFYDEKTKGFSLKACLDKYRTLADNGMTRLIPGETAGTEVKDANAYDLCTPTHDTCTEVECDSVFEGYQQPGMIRRKY